VRDNQSQKSIKPTSTVNDKMLEIGTANQNNYISTNRKKLVRMNLVSVLVILMATSSVTIVLQPAYAQSTSNNTAATGNVTGVNSPANSGNSTVSLKVGNQAYPIKYQITGGKVNGVAIDKDNSTIVANISTTSNGSLTIELPRNVIDSKNPGNVDDKFVVFIDGNNVAFDEVKNNTQARTLKIDFDNGSQQIAIAGTHVVPEFGGIAAIILVTSLIGIVIYGAKYSDRFNLLRHP
jgi:hypothetical protein